MTIGGAGILEVGNAAALGTGPLTINGGLLLGTTDETLTNALQMSGAFNIAAATGTTLNLASATPWTLANGSSVVFGPAGQNGTVIWHSPAGSQISNEGGVSIDVQGGTLKAGDAGFTFLLFNSPQILVEAGATIDLAGFGAQFFNLQGSGTITDSGGAANVTIGNSNFAGTLSGALSLDVLGPVTLTGTNTYTGTTTLTINTLTLGNGGTTGSIAGQSAINDGTSLIFDRSNAYTVANVISGTGSVQQVGTGTTTLTAANSYSGGTTITAGTLVAANAKALGTGPVTLTGGELLATTDLTITSLALSGNVTLAAAKGATLDIAPPVTLSLTQASGDTITFGAPGESGTVIWTPPPLGELALNGTIDLDTLLVQAGTLKGAVAPGNPAVDELPTNVVLRTVVDAAGTIDIAGAQDQINDLQGAGTVTDSVGGGTLTLNGGNFAGVIKGNLNLTTIGTVTLTGTETYGGLTIIDGGSTLTLGNGGTTGSLPSTSSVIDNGTLVFDRSNAVTFANIISGTGAVQQIGTGTTTLTGANTYAGGTTIAAGELVAANASALGTGPLTMTGGELLTTTTETLTNALHLNGAETIAAATGTTLTLNSPDPFAFVGGTSLTFGAPGRNGTIIWHTPPNEISGGVIQTIDVAAGTLKAGDANFASLTMHSAVRMIVEAGATVDLAGFSTSILNLEGGGRVTDSGAPATLQISGNLLTNSINRADFAGTISGPLQLSILGPVSLTGTNTYTGSTTINGQSNLILGNGGTTGSIAGGSVIDNGTLTFNRSNAVSFGNPISGTGQLVQAGSGTTTLRSAANTYSGGTIIANGTLAVGSGAALGSGTLTINGGELLGTGIETISNSLALSGSITIAAAHGGLLILSPTQVNATGLTELVIGAPGQDGIVFWNSLAQTTTAGQSGTLDLRAGTLEVQTLLPFTQTIVEAGATLDVAGASLLTDQIFLNNLQGAGTITDSGQPATLVLTGSTTFGGTLSGALSLDIAGNTTLAGTTEVADGTILNPVRVDTLSLINTGTFILGSDAGVTGLGASFQQSFVNDGVFEKTAGTGTSEVSVPFTNNGTIVVTSGSINFAGGLDNIGIIEGQLSGTTVSAAPVGETFFYGGTGSNHFTVATAPTLISCAAGGTNTVEVTASLAFTAGSLVNVQDVQVDNGVSADLSRLTSDENIVSTSLSGGGATIIGTQGNDTITAGAGNDMLFAGPGNDSLVGGAGNSTLSAGSGYDTLTGGTGNEYLISNAGHTTLSAAGGDNVFYAGPNATVSMTGGSGNDTMYANGGNSDTLVAGSGATLIWANASSGNDSITLNGRDTLFGGTGDNAISITGDGNQAHLAGAADTATIGGPGNDTVWSYGGHDTILAGASSGNDDFILGPGTSSIMGGSGSNTFEFTSGFGNSAIEGGTSGNNVAYFDGLSENQVAIHTAGAVTTVTFGGSTATLMDVQHLVFTDGHVNP